VATKVIGYGMVSEKTIEKLVEKVQESIGKGWQPLGGASSYGNGFFLQTLIRYAPKENPSRRVKG
jgi:hypothetical protein